MGAFWVLYCHADDCGYKKDELLYLIVNHRTYTTLGNNFIKTNGMDDDATDCVCNVCIAVVFSCDNILTHLVFLCRKEWPCLAWRIENVCQLSSRKPYDRPHPGKLVSYWVLTPCPMPANAPIKYDPVPRHSRLTPNTSTHQTFIIPARFSADTLS